MYRTIRTPTQAKKQKHENHFTYLFFLGRGNHGGLV